jgi:ABC-type glycerol-3-phosphate transport system permease component
MKTRSRPLKTLALPATAVLRAIAVVCVFPFWWTLVTAISTEGNIFAFPPTFWPKAPSFDNFIEVFNAIRSGLLQELRADRRLHRILETGCCAHWPRPIRWRACTSGAASWCSA